jgi:hypothetical protein
MCLKDFNLSHVMALFDRGMCLKCPLLRNGSARWSVHDDVIQLCKRKFIVDE